jgi:hypothetical protein
MIEEGRRIMIHSTGVLVPIHLDALRVQQERTAVGPPADFSKLPFFNGKYQSRARVANISEEIVAHPFEDRDFYLEPGIHLHWALPDAFTKASQWAGKTSKPVFPPVPNRWLVRIKTPSRAHEWVVESDYVFSKAPTGSRRPLRHVSIPYAPAASTDTGSRQPYRYLGRAWPIEEWRRRPKYDSDNYLSLSEPLTAIGYGERYGEPTFAAFYPNCHSVFGFFDSPGDGEETTYEVIGWYHDPDIDFTRTVLQRALRIRPSHEIVAKILEEQFQWSLSDASEAGEAIRPRTICYARLTVTKSSAERTPQPSREPPSITIGNTITEALSAHLAHEADGDKSKSDKSKIEDQLEAVLLSARLEHRQVDIGAKFREARHEKGFSPTGAGILWSVRPQPKEGAEPSEQVTLEEHTALLLHDLNVLQQAYQRAHDEIDSLRHQLFADWYKYMLSAYPAGGSYEQPIDSDEIRFFIDQQTLPALEKKIASTGTLVVSSNPRRIDLL